MLGLCLYVPVANSDPIEVEYYESNRLPLELKSLFKLSVFLPSQELSTYQKWRKVSNNNKKYTFFLYACVNLMSLTHKLASLGYINWCIKRYFLAPVCRHRQMLGPAPLTSSELRYVVEAARALQGG